GRRPGGQNNGKKRFGEAFAGERKPEGAKPFKGNNKRRFGGKRPAARAA
ncbi:MAG: ATP-dependent helicase, partial [Mesorhizobium sp.]